MPPKNLSPRHAQMRIRIAQLAAQLMLEHGIRDYALAKRKAARQLGAPESHSLPGNEEVEAALRAHQALYRPDEHKVVLETLRRQALAVLQSFARFDPVLVGGVLNGTATRHSDIEIELYADSSKEFEQHLLNAGIAFKVKDRGGAQVYLLYAEPADVWVRILPREQRHAGGRGRQEGPRRMNAKQLAALLGEEKQTG
ncbi:MAG: hypothetical protein RMK60_04680 [Burkholderiales bacterium]|nr:hypothetical protein [Burkholderiales bacterium]